MSKYFGDFDAGKTVYVPFTTNDGSGNPATLGGTPAVKVYKGSNTTEVTTGVTLSVDFDGVTGSHLVAVDMSSDGTFYAAGTEFRAVITAGTVAGTSVVGSVVGEWSCQNRVVSKVAGSVTGDLAGKVLGGGATSITGVGANVNVTQSLGVSVTSFDGTLAGATSTTVTFPTTDANGDAIPDDGRYAYTVLYLYSGTGKKQLVNLTTATGTARQYSVQSGTMPVTPDNTTTYLVMGSWRANATVSLGTNAPANWINAAAVASGALNGKGDWLLSGGYTAPPTTTAIATAVEQQIMDETDSRAVLAAIVAKINSTDTNLAGLSIAAIAAAVWDLATSGHTSTGTFGSAMNAAGGSGDPWATSLPGSYGNGTAGKIVGDRVAASVTAPVTVGANNDKTGYALTSAYDAAKTAGDDSWAGPFLVSSASGVTVTLTGGPTGLTGECWARFYKTADGTSSFGIRVLSCASSVLTFAAAPGVDNTYSCRVYRDVGLPRAGVPALDALLDATDPTQLSAHAQALSTAGSDPLATDVVARALDNTYTGTQLGRIFARWWVMGSNAAVSDTSPTATTFKLGSGLAAGSGSYVGQQLEFVSGALVGQRRAVTAFGGGGNPSVTVDPPFTGAPASGDLVTIV